MKRNRVVCLSSVGDPTLPLRGVGDLKPYIGMELSGVSEREWDESLQDCPAMGPPAKSLIVISPHPDDETLGAGGLIASYRKQGRKVLVVAVTDGEAAYPNADGLGERRVREQEEALAVLGVDASCIIRWGLPDSGLGSYEAEIGERLLGILTKDDWVVAPHVWDYHPDHEICGRAARAAAQACAGIAFYFFWTWHRGNPEQLAGLPLRRFELSEEVQGLRKQALAKHYSQLRWRDSQPILPASLLGPMARPYEIFSMERQRRSGDV